MLKEAKNILVINLRYIGDTVWMYPFIRNLKLNLPNAKISALINKGGEELLGLLPELSEVITVDRKKIKSKGGIFRFINILREIRSRRFDTVFVLSNSDRPNIVGFLSGAKKRIGFDSDGWRRLLLTDRFVWKVDDNPHMIEYYLQALKDAGLRVYDESLRMNLPEDLLKAMLKRFPTLKSKDRKSLLIHPGAGNRLRQWGVKNFADVINSVSSKYRVFLIGGPYERGIINEILAILNKPPDIVSTELSLLEFAALCKFTDLFLGNDSGPIHIAAAVGTFTIGIYGPTLSRHCAPWTEKRAIFEADTLYCRPCSQKECINPQKQACLMEIKPGMVIEKINELL